MTHKISLISIFIFVLLFSSCINYNKELKEHKSRGETVSEKTKQWILTQSKFPDSYQSVDFSPLDETSTVEPKGWFIFKVMRTVPGSEKYTITHKYYLLDHTGQKILNYSRFVYDKDFNLKGFCNYVTDSSEISQIYPETIDDADWKALYGK